VGDGLLGDPVLAAVRIDERDRFLYEPAHLLVQGGVDQDSAALGADSVVFAP
jgi:hypothetical protein